MTVPASAKPEDLQRSFKQAIHDHWVLYLIQGAVMVLLGLFAIAVPVATALTIELYVGWLFLISGIVGLATLVGKHNVPAFLWTLVGAVLALVVGVMLVWRPAAGVLSLALLLTGFFIAEGVSQILAALKNRSVLGNAWLWLLLSGIVDLGLAGIVISGWPGTAAWILGMFVGINLFMSGFALVMTAFACRDVTRVAGTSQPAV